MPSPLVLELLCTKYGGEEDGTLDDLQQLLSRHNTVAPFVLRRAEDVLLSLDGLVQNRYRFTQRGLSMLCTRLCPGLGSVFSNIAGAYETAGEIDPPTAVRILNAVIRLRFDSSLLECRLIIDPVRSGIDGVVSSQYAFLSNCDWLTSCIRFAEEEAGAHARFLSASLAGRRLLVHYVDDRTWFRVSNPDGVEDNYRRGWSFTNSETGESAVRVGMLIVDDHGNACLRHAARQTHTKKLRETKGQNLLTKLRESCLKANHTAFARGIARMHRQEIVRPSRLTDLSQLAEHLTTQLTKRVPRNVARLSVSNTLSPAVFNSQLQPAGMPAAAVSYSPLEHSHYQLYFALTSQARECFPREQENVEALAYELLRNKFSLGVD